MFLSRVRETVKRKIRPRETRGNSSIYNIILSVILRANYLGIVGSLLDDFRCHPERRPDESVPFAGRVGQLSGNAKIGQLDVAHLAQQNVRRLKATRLKVSLEEREREREERGGKKRIKKKNRLIFSWSLLPFKFFSLLC